MVASGINSKISSNARLIWLRYADAVRPLPDLDPATFAAEHRVLHSVYCTERPGKWDNSVFPYQPHLMNMVQEAIKGGKRGVVYMKSGQGGGTDLAINGLMWLKMYYPGPQLFMTATDKVASEFGRERFQNIIDDMPPLKAKYLPNKHGDILTKRFTDGKIQLTGGQSIFNLQSTPYRFVGIDELDSLADDIKGSGDPLALAEVRMDSFSGQTMAIAYAHPSTTDRGAARLFFESSDQRRGFVKHDCGGEFWLQWSHIKIVGEATEAYSYQYVCPNCGAVITDAERVSMIRGVSYRSVLPPEEAKKRQWIGGHFSQLYYPAKTIRGLAQRWIDCGDDEAQKRVFFNKVLGEPYDPKIKKVDMVNMRALVVIKRRQNDPEFYLRGQVPPWVRFLTAGQDSRNKELHFSIWGWGLRRCTDGTLAQCGALIDWGCIKREYNPIFEEREYHVFDELIYRRTFFASYGNRTYNVLQCGHDIGYKPTQIPVIRYCRTIFNRAFPVKGASVEATNQCNAPYVKWGTAMRFKAGENTKEDSSSRQLLFNTYLLKNMIFGWLDESSRIIINDVSQGKVIGVRKVPHLVFPEDVEDEVLKQIKNESLIKGKKKNEEVYNVDGPNHYGDTAVYSLGLAHNLDWFQGQQTTEEAQAKNSRRNAPDDAPDNNFDPALG